MTDHNYPVDPRKAPRFDVATYFAVLIEESGFPVVTPDDQDRLTAVLNDFLYQQPKGATR